MLYLVEEAIEVHGKQLRLNKAALPTIRLYQAEARIYFSLAQ